MSLQGYEATQVVVEGPRQTEYRLFATITRALMDAAKNTESKTALVAAVDWNRRLWSTLQFDLADDDNGLPDDLKARLTSVAIWVDKHSSLVMKGEGKVDSLISVNRTIMEGLV
jgi:flagellar protein FlaF